MPRDPHFVQACAVEMQVNISQKPLHTEIYRKNVAAQKRHPHFVRACAAEIHVNVLQATLYGNWQEKCRGPDWAQNADTHFVRACAVEMQVNISQKPLYTEKCRGSAGAPAFTPTVRSPQCEHTVWGKIMSHSYPQLRVYLEKKQPCPSLPAAKYLLGRPMRYLFMLRLDIVLVRCSVWTRVASSNQVWVKPHPVLMQQKVKLSQTKVQHQQLHRGTYFCLHIATDVFFCTCKNTLHEKNTRHDRTNIIYIYYKTKQHNILLVHRNTSQHNTTQQCNATLLRPRI